MAERFEDSCPKIRCGRSHRPPPTIRSRVKQLGHKSDRETSAGQWQHPQQKPEARCQRQRRTKLHPSRRSLQPRCRSPRGAVPRLRRGGETVTPTGLILASGHRAAKCGSALLATTLPPFRTRHRQSKAHQTARRNHTYCSTSSTSSPHSPLVAVPAENPCRICLQILRIIRPIQWGTAPCHLCPGTACQFELQVPSSPHHLSSKSAAFFRLLRHP